MRQIISLIPRCFSHDYLRVKRVIPSGAQNVAWRAEMAEAGSTPSSLPNLSSCKACFRRCWVPVWLHLYWRVWGGPLSIFFLFPRPVTERQWWRYWNYTLQEGKPYCLCFRWWESSGFLMVPGVILEIRLNFERKCLCVYVHFNRELLTPCALSRDHVRHFVPNQFVLNWLGGVLFENGLMSCAYLRFVEACKRDCGRRK